jgi:co-chaperonin GroES (HSP10)
MVMQHHRFFSNSMVVTLYIILAYASLVNGLANLASGVGRFVFDSDAATGWQCHYDMVLVERIQGKPKMASGLYVPDDQLPKMQLCRVLSLGPGREEENGMIAPMPTDLRVGDIVMAKNPWGIGPKDEETMNGQKLSYMRSHDIAAKITGGLIPEDDDA